MILLVGICFSMTSCTKARTLKGTTWIGTKSYSEYTANLTLSFFESTYSLDEKDSDGGYYTTTGNYTYNDPVVTLFLNGESFSGTVSGDNLLLREVNFTRR